MYNNNKFKLLCDEIKFSITNYRTGHFVFFTLGKLVMWTF